MLFSRRPWRSSWLKEQCSRELGRRIFWKKSWLGRAPEVLGDQIGYYSIVVPRLLALLPFWLWGLECCHQFYLPVPQPNTLVTTAHFLASRSIAQPSGILCSCTSRLIQFWEPAWYCFFTAQKFAVEGNLIAHEVKLNESKCLWFVRVWYFICPITCLHVFGSRFKLFIVGLITLSGYLVSKTSSLTFNLNLLLLNFLSSRWRRLDLEMQVQATSLDQQVCQCQFQVSSL